MGSEKQFSEFRKLARSDRGIEKARIGAMSNIEIRKYDADFDIAAAICDTVDEMALEYLAAYHKWLGNEGR